MNKGYKVVWFGKEVVCYGDLEETSNFEVVCKNEGHDDIWCLGAGPYVGDMLTWDNVVVYLQGFFESEIVEITAC